MKKVLLTGISGYIGLHCAAELLRQGYSVRGSLRSLAKAEKITKILSEHVNTEDRLEYCELDLLKDEGWDKAMEDCDYLMHVASPFFSRVPKDENELIRPAVAGTERALKSAHRSGIKRVVLTSSMVAMLEELNGSQAIDHTSWTNVNSPKATAYLKSKTLAEQKAWEYAKANDMELVTVHPGPVYGPPLSDNLSGESMATIERVITGGMPRVVQAGINMSDVRDVAQIHVLALENTKAAGQRYIVATEKAHTFVDVANILKEGGYSKVSSKTAPNWLMKFMANFNSEAKGMMPYVGNVYQGNVKPTMETFDWRPIALEKTLLETADAITKIRAQA